MSKVWIQKRNKSYIVRYRITFNGITKEKSESYKNEDDAYLRKMYVKSCLEKNIIPESRKKGINRILFSDFLNIYVEEYGKENWRINNFSANVSIINSYIRPYFSKMYLDELDRSLLRQFSKDILDTNMVGQHNTKQEKKFTLNRRWEVFKRLKSIFNYAYKEGYIKKNPLIDFDIKKSNNIKIKKEKNDGIWTFETLKYVLKNTKDDILKLAIQLSVTTGTRISELAGLRWNDVVIDHDNNVYKIMIRNQLQRFKKELLTDPRFAESIVIILDNQENLKDLKKGIINNPKITTVKGLTIVKTLKSNREISISQNLVELLINERKKQLKNKKILGNKYHENNLVICFDNGDPIERKVLNNRLKSTINQLDGVNEITFHKLRHLSATYLYDFSGKDIKVVQDFLGHENSKTTLEIYTHIFDKTQKEVGEKMGILLEEN